MTEIKLTEDYYLHGFDSEPQMAAWIQEFNSMEGEDAPPFFERCCEYKGFASDCTPREKWVERNGKMDSGGYWYKPYDKTNNAPSDRHCYNHYCWAFDAALRAAGNPKYIIIVNINCNSNQQK